MANPILLCARHSSTAYNASELGDAGQRVRGFLDLKLTTLGRKESEELASKLAKFPIEEIFSSDLTRALETAHILGDKIHMPVEPTRNLRPWNLGRLQGELVKRVMPIMEHFITHENEVVPAGESFAAFRIRCLSFVRKMAAKAAADHKTICLITHTRDLQLIKSHLAAGAPEDLSIDRGAMDDYSDEIKTGGFLEVLPHEVLGPEWKHGASKDSIEDE